MQPDRFKVRGWLTKQAKEEGCPPKATYDTFTISELMRGNYTYRYYENWEQSTGLKDKNGVEIFEGDIVECKRELNDEVDDYHTGVVTWDEKYCHFYFKSIKNEISRTIGGKEESEIIGNIHDNPELLT